MGLQLKKRVVESLKGNSGHRFTGSEIANWIFEKYPYECNEKKAKSQSLRTDVDLKRQIAAEISSIGPGLQLEYDEIMTTDERPRRYYWETGTDKRENEKASDADEASQQLPGTRTVKESDLYGPLSRYIWDEFKVYSKRIDEKKSTNKQERKGNKWLYPDLVGMEDLTAGMHSEIRDVIKESADKQKRLWSFEVKRQLTRSTVREAYFQAVSNSSWANLGYLVAAVVHDDAMKELRMLCSLHGIGLIEINLDELSKCRISIPAREKADVDWSTCNRIATENEDFREFVKFVRQFHQTGDPQPNVWDMVRKPKRG